MYVVIVEMYVCRSPLWRWWVTSASHLLSFSLRDLPTNSNQLTPHAPYTQIAKAIVSHPGLVLVTTTLYSHFCPLL